MRLRYQCDYVNEKPFPAVVVRTFRFADRAHVGAHVHRSHQLIYSVTGSMAIQTAEERWYVPPTRGVWMPSETLHSIDCYGDVDMKTAFVRPDEDVTLPSVPHEVQISPLLRELLMFAADEDASSDSFPVAGVRALLMHQSVAVTESPLAVPLTDDRRTV